MNSFLIVLALAAVANAVPTAIHAPVIAVAPITASSYALKTQHPVPVPAPIIKGVPQPYAVPVPQPYDVPRAVPVAVPRPVPVVVPRAVPVPVVAQSAPIVQSSVISAAPLIADGLGADLGLVNGGLGLGLVNGGLGLGLGVGNLGLGLADGLGGAIGHGKGY